MDLNYEGIYYTILSGKSVAPTDDFPFTTGYEDVTKEEILEILQTHFGVDFGYDVKKWQQYIEDNGGWFVHYWEGKMFETEHKILMKKYRK